ncbi:MFS transporter [Kribbella voronezhensis]|uniref:MFS transporter n=1 Tax=Kribbella voronezhensis TaxID=2512212 RepID=A0A4R7T7Z0_9ACTN|nr:MFS transporter [Kribbella voronezhensis]TDU88052.1 MFS transporter [Kribbella voronezhensis]
MTNSRGRLVALCTVQFVDVMGVTVVVSAMPRMLADLGGSAAQAGLLVPAYAVGFSSLLLLAARLGDRFGHRRTLVAGLLVFAIGSTAAAAAPTLSLLVAARGIQGVAAAISVPNALVLLTRRAQSKAARERALGAWNACGGLAGASGLLVGGLTTSAVSWRAIFWGNLVVTAVLVAVLLRLVERDRPSEELSAGFDPRSVVLQVVAVGAVVAAANATAKPWPIPVALGLAGVLAAAWLVVRERRTARPLVAAGLWRPTFVAGLLGSFGITATTSSLVVVGTVYFQEEKGFSPASAGLMILPFSLGAVVAAGLAGRLMPRTGPRRTLAFGLVLIFGGGAAVWLSSTPAALIVALVLAGLGNGMGAVAAYGLGTAVPAEQQGSAAGLLNTAAQVGTAMMVAITVAIASRADGLDYRAGWLTVALTALAVLISVSSVTRHRTRRRC